VRGLPHSPRSDNASLIATSVVSLSKTTRTVSVETSTAPRALCVACHDAKRDAFGGPDAYAATKHSTVTSSSCRDRYRGRALPAARLRELSRPPRDRAAPDVEASGRTRVLRVPRRGGQDQTIDVFVAGLDRDDTWAHAAPAIRRIGDAYVGIGLCSLHAVHGGEASWDATVPPGSLWTPESRLCLGSARAVVTRPPPLRHSA